ncbi:hypothetical protein AVEN_151512-1 [Araneus ventricosus]|uniref:Uncharacterized protein n=1 Tax=Araneus ventricosus TaxID=182803 RepID=A0A4Y2IS56_ARAVE|nr:hypothetical protein AVEN_151512-1 [Araneus ventricosus]
MDESKNSHTHSHNVIDQPHPVIRLQCPLPIRSFDHNVYFTSGHSTKVSTSHPVIRPQCPLHIRSFDHIFHFTSGHSTTVSTSLPEHIWE